MSKATQRLVVGEQFAPGLTFGETERFEYRYTNGTHMLQVIMPRLTPAEIEAFQRGKMHVGLYVRGDTIFFLWKVEGIQEWSDQAFSLFALPPDSRSVEPARNGEHILLSMVLLDSHTGVVKAMRVITYSTHMSQIFQRLLMRQLQNGLSPEQHALNIKEAYALYPHSRDMVKAALCTERAGLIQPGDNNHPG